MRAVLRVRAGDRSRHPEGPTRVRCRGGVAARHGPHTATSSSAPREPASAWVEGGGEGCIALAADGSRIVIRGPVCSRRGSCRRALRRYVSRGRGQGPRRGPCGRGPSGRRVRHAVVVVFHSIVCQYRRRKERQAVRQKLDAAGLHARRDTALAWLRLEPDDEHPGRAALRLTLWPGGYDELLARSGYHGRPVEWLGSAPLPNVGTWRAPDPRLPRSTPAR
jgi:hypothetical protein